MHCRIENHAGSDQMSNMSSLGPARDELHPAALGPRIVRALSTAQRLPAWGRMAQMFVGASPQGPFRVRSRHGWFEGDIASYIDRQVYLRGWYEADEIAAFLAMIPQDRRGTILDVGANVGTHAVAFARAFESVHAFEPNPVAIAQLERNVALNRADNVQVHPVGLAEQAGQLDFFLTERSNFGLGTFSQHDQYDVPLKKAGHLTVEVGDTYLERIGCSRVDAVKIDVQGFEPEVLRGLKHTLMRDKPFLWFELSTGTSAKLDDLQQLSRLVPYDFSLHIFSNGWSVAGRTVLLREVDGSQPLPCGDYIIVPTRGR
jgi:FkbM family methyltransferase